MNIAIGSDHGGYLLKNAVITMLHELGHQVADAGCYTEASVDYPDYAELVAARVLDNSVQAGILICGTGIGMSIAANRFPEIRAALCHDEYTARMSREHNNANVLCLGARVLDEAAAKQIVRVWLSAEFAGGRHQRRIGKLDRNGMAG